MSNVTKPTSYLNWTDGAGTKVTQPPAPQMLSGWTVGEPIPFQYLNWLFYTTDQWIQYLDQETNVEASDVNINASMRLINGGTWSFNATTGVLAWSSAFNIAIPSVPDADNQASAGNVTLTDGQVAYVSSNLPFTTSGQTTNTSNQVVMAYTLGISVGQNVTGTGIPGSTTVTAINNTTSTITISNNATATGTANLTFSGSTTLTVTAATSSTLLLSPNTVIIARRVGAQVFLGINSSYEVLNDGEAKTLLMGGFITTSFFTAGQALTQGQAVYVSQGAGIGDTTTTSGTSGGAGTTITVGSATGLFAGMGVTGTNVSGGTTIVSVVGTTVTLSATTSGAASGNYVFTRIAGQVYLLDCGSTFGFARAGFIGFVMTTVAIGASAQIITDGNIGDFTSLTVGALYYGDPATLGGITATKTLTTGQWVVPVGTAMASTILDMNAGLGSSASQVVIANSWPTFYVNSSATLDTAIAGCLGAGGGVISIIGAFTITAAKTLPTNTLLIGQLGASVMTIGTGGSLVLSDNSKLQYVWFTTLNTTGSMVIASSNYSTARDCSFTTPSSSTGQCINVTGNANKFYNNVFIGVAGETAIGINYASGVDNMDTDSVFLP